MKKALTNSSNKSEKPFLRQISAPSFGHSVEFDYKRSAKYLWKALKQSTVDHTLNLNFILRFYSSYKSEQRLLLVHGLEYEYDYKLIDMILAQPESPLRSCALAILVEPTELYVREFRDLLSLKSTNKNDFEISRKLVDILLVLNNKETQKFKEIYETFFETAIKTDIENVHGDGCIMSKLLIALLEGKRYEEPGYSASAAKIIAKQLYETHDDIPGIDYDTLIKIFTRDGFSQLSTIFDTYEDKYGQPIQEAIEHEFHGQLEAQCFEDIIEYTRSPSGYHARELRQALDKKPIDYKTLIRIIIGHEDKDLCEIDLEYSKQFDDTLDQAIENCLDIEEIKQLFIKVIKTRRDAKPDDNEQEGFRQRNNSSPTHAAITTFNANRMRMKNHLPHEAFDKLMHVFRFRRPH